MTITNTKESCYLMIVNVNNVDSDQKISGAQFRLEIKGEDGEYAAFTGDEALEDGQSVELILDRPPRFVANGVMNRIVFNGKEYGMLGNGKEMTLTTRQLHNRLEVFVGFKSAVYEFDAVVGERHLITVENTLSDVLLHVESPAAAEISSKK